MKIGSLKHLNGYSYTSVCKQQSGGLTDTHLVIYQMHGMGQPHQWVFKILAKNSVMQFIFFF